MSEPISTGQPLAAHDLVAPLAPLPEDPQLYFEESWRAGLGDVDVARRARLDSVARYLQDVGYDHLVAAGFGEVHPSWVVQRTLIDSQAPTAGLLRERLTLRRWCSGMARFWCSVRVQVVGDQGTHFESEAFWINFNKETKAPARISDEFIARFGRATDNHHLRWKPLLSPEPSAEALAGAGLPWQLRSTDIDQFQHVNNAAYWEAVEHVLRGSDLLSGRYRAIVEYISPVQPEEPVVLRWAVSGSGADVWFVVDGKAKAAAKVIRR